MSSIAKFLKFLVTGLLFFCEFLLFLIVELCIYCSSFCLSLIHLVSYQFDEYHLDCYFDCFPCFTRFTGSFFPFSGAKIGLGLWLYYNCIFSYTNVCTHYTDTKHTHQQYVYCIWPKLWNAALCDWY